MKFVTFCLAPVLALLLFGCSSTEVATTDNPTDKPRQEKAQPKAQELGSLWSEESRWNFVYSYTSSRLVGEGLRLKVEEALKSRVMQTAPADVVKALSAVKKESQNRAPASAGAASEGIPVTVSEILPNGVIRVTGTQTINLGAISPKVEIEANAKEKDISSDDEISSDQLFNVKLNTVFPSVDTSAVKAGAKTAEKPAVKPEPAPAPPAPAPATSEPSEKTEKTESTEKKEESKS